jgi:hypothetical protein
MREASKRLQAVALSFLLVCSLVAVVPGAVGTAAANAAGTGAGNAPTGPAGMYGDGTAANPYVITNLTQLQAMEQDPQAAYALGEDIDASATATWDGGFDPVGGETVPFTGRLDGRDYAITDLTVTQPRIDRVGLFGVTSGSHIGNLTLSRVSVTGGDRTGGLAGAASGTVEAVSVSGTVSGTEYVGGLAGYSSATLTNVSTATDVDGEFTVGGLVGRSFEPITDARASGTVDGVVTVGGLVGYSSDDISDATASGAVDGTETVGGLVGNNYNFGDVTDSRATGDANGSAIVGGLVGRNSGDILRSTASGTVTGTERVGGLLGMGGGSEDGGSVSESSASGDVQGETDVGGLAGKNTGAIGNSTASGPVAGTTNVGGLVGNNTQYDRYSVVYNGTVTDSAATGTVDGVTNVGGLAGRNSETIARSSADGAVDGTDHVGGLVGTHLYGTVSTVAASGAVAGDTAVGGLVGDQVLAGVSNATAVGAVTGEESVGGLVGDAYSGDIADASAGGSVTGEENVGGLVGDSISGAIVNASATGSVDGTFSVGGLVGVGSTDIVNSWASGDVNGSDNVGGLAGDLTFGFASNTSATGAVTGSDRVGGLVGRLDGSSSGVVVQSWATGSVTGVDDTGGLVGSNSGTVTEAYCLNTSLSCVGLGNDDGVTALETVQMQGASARYTMANLTFGGPWLAVESEYPELASNRRTSADVATIDAGASSVAVTTPQFADGTDASSVTVTLVDSGGDPVTGLEASEFDVAVDGSAVTTGISETGTGVYEFTVTDDVAESVSVSVTADGKRLADEPTIRFAERTPAFFDVGITDTDGPVRAGNDLTVTATVTNTGDVAGTQTVTLDAFAEADSTTVSLAPGESTTVDLVWTTGVGVGGEGTRGEIRVTVASANASDEATVTVRPPVVDRFDSTIEVTSPHIANGSDPATVTVSLVNRSNDQPLSGIDQSEFEIDAGDATVDSGVTETSPGVYEFAVTSTLAQRELVRVTVDGVEIDQFPPPEVEFIESGTAYFVVEITETNEPVTAGETLTVTAEVRNGGDTSGTQNVTLFGGRGPFNIRDGSEVTLEPGESATITRAWQTAERDGGESGVVVRSDNTTDSRGVRLDIPPKEPAGTLATMAGNGTVENPYVVTNLTQLQAMAQDTHANYVLGTDIDASETATWDGGFDPVGRSSEFGVESERGETPPTFTGSFDGRNHTITGLYVDRPESSAVGLFGAVEYARIENVALVGGTVTGRNAVGALVGDGHDSAISEASASVDVTGERAVGGLVGVTDGTVTRSYATGSVTVRGKEEGFGGGPAGGLVGLLMGSAEGLRPSAEGASEGSGTAIVTQSYATANVTGFQINPLVGRLGGSLTESYGAGNTTLPDGEQPLLSGESERPPVLVEGPSLEPPGATDGNVSNVYRDTDRTMWSISRLGTGLTTAQMTGRAAATNMTGFDFEQAWVLTERYPRLRWSLESVAVTPAAVTLETGETTQATVTADFVDGTTETATTTADYSSSDTGVATVDEDGTITAVGGGTTTVTATVGGQQATATLTVPDRVAPSADAGNDSTVTVGDSVAFDAGGSGDNVGIDTYQWRFGDGASATGERASHRYDSAGTYTAELTVTDAAGNAATDTVTVRVEREPTTASSGGSSSDRDSTEVDVERTDDGWTVVVSGARQGTAIPAAFDDGVGQRNLTVTDIRLNVTRGGYFRLDVATEDGDGQAPEFASATGARSVGTVTVDHTIADTDIDDVTFAFRLHKRAVDDIDAESVALYREGPDGWTRLPTALVGENATHYAFESRSPGLSVFAVGTPGPAFDVTETRLANTTIRAGESAAVTVTVENRGAENGTYPLELAADGSTVASQSVAVPAGERRTVTLSPTFETAGSYALTVGNVTVGDMSVTAAAEQPAPDRAATSGESSQPTDEATGTPNAEPDTEPAGLNPAVVGAIVALVVGIAAVGVARYRGLLE